MVCFDRSDLDKLIKGYSHGMKNKMQMLATVIASPEVILLDEPLTSLDVVAAHEMKEMLMNMKKDHIIIFSTHILQLAKDLCDEIVLLHGGKLAGVADEVYHSADFEEKLIQMLSAESDEDTENIDMWSADAGLYEQNLSDDKNRNEKDNLMTDGNTENHTQSDSRTDDYDPYDFD
jgi:ABC-type multidrug transport system ATPase subunit